MKIIRTLAQAREIADRLRREKALDRPGLIPADRWRPGLVAGRDPDASALTGRCRLRDQMSGDSRVSFHAAAQTDVPPPPATLNTGRKTDERGAPGAREDVATPGAAVAGGGDRIVNNGAE